MADRADLGELLRNTWSSACRLPAGKRIFSMALGRLIPYSGTIHPRILNLEPGFARVQMRDQHNVRNHLRSVHAIAIMNLAELSTGLALNASLPVGARSILTGLSIEYLKKARGTLTAQCRCDPVSSTERKDYELHSSVCDESGSEVARAQARWLVGPAR